MLELDKERSIQLKESSLIIYKGSLFEGKFFVRLLDYETRISSDFVEEGP